MYNVQISNKLTSRRGARYRRKRRLSANTRFALKVIFAFLVSVITVLFLLPDPLDTSVSSTDGDHVSFKAIEEKVKLKAKEKFAEFKKKSFEKINVEEPVNGPLEKEEATVDNEETLQKDDWPYFGTSEMQIPYLPKGGGRFHEYSNGTSPYIITESIRQQSDDLARKRRTHIKNAMKHAWGGYAKYAFGYDELLPVSGKGQQNWFGVGTTLVDSLDTLWLMDMKDEFYQARDWVRDSLSHDVDHLVSTFENTIRSLGGLLSAYYFSQDTAFLEKAQDIGQRLFKAFNSPSGVPYFQVNLKTGIAKNELWSPQETQISAAGSLQLEFRELARITHNREYDEKSMNALDKLYALNPPDGLYTTAVKNSSPQIRPGLAGARITFGGRADSFYEYMLKLWLQTGKTETKFRQQYDKSMDGLHDKILRYSDDGLAYLIKLNSKRRNEIHEMEHLECFMGGLLALGAYTDPNGLDSKRAQRDLQTAKALTYTCYQMYAVTDTGIGGEISHGFKPLFKSKIVETANQHQHTGIEPKRNAEHYLLRPEAVESLFILNHLTGDPIYREWGWEMFQAIESYCKTKYGYGAHPDVRDRSKKPNDSMESFFLGETLKYFYLLFDPDSKLDLTKHVFNTEAHPLPILNPFFDS
ncbi:hypothetical protein CTEN210_12918 [Chaetoceros tenuissimus]|uniref:alpha-1,2-Mannosidase n=1 Tax=Chaetoceros tenuissimus TaxID=426638 RepID=A0AAD3D231_9STRA|nr:hypothetical protein CTEN210_12918 [Chaetoceros tenuissimus]